jgi:2-methylcitrate dehydratase
MGGTHDVDRLSRFVVDASVSDVGASLTTLKRNVLDSIACALGALDGELIPAIRAQAEQFSSRPTATFIGGGSASVDQAAFFNAVLVRYPDLLDTFLTPGGLCHPADNFGAILAMAEHVGAAGADFLLALAVAYEVQCRFSAQVPVMARGLNHALPLAMSVAAGAAKLLEFDAGHTASAIAASAVDNVSLAAVHAEPVSSWKGISPAVTGMRAIYTTLLVGRGVSGPRSLLEGPNGLAQLFDQPIDFRTDDHALTSVEQTYLKKYCALIHGQVVIDATLDLRDENQLSGGDISHVTLEVFQSAYDIAGGGRFGDKDHPQTKEQADYRGGAARRPGRTGAARNDTRPSRRRAEPAAPCHCRAGWRPDGRLPRTHLDPGADRNARRPQPRTGAVRFRRIAQPPHDVGSRCGEVAVAGGAVR